MEHLRAVGHVPLNQTGLFVSLFGSVVNNSWKCSFLFLVSVHHCYSTAQSPLIHVYNTSTRTHTHSQDNTGLLHPYTTTLTNVNITFQSLSHSPFDFLIDFFVLFLHVQRHVCVILVCFSVKIIACWYIHEDNVVNEMHWGTWRYLVSYVTTIYIYTQYYVLFFRWGSS